MNNYKNIVSKLIVTCFFIGKIKYAPGTFGSLLAFPITYYLVALIVKSRFLLPIQGFTEAEREFVTIMIFLILSVVILSIIAIFTINIYLKDCDKEDPPEIVIDEVIGQMLTSILTFFSIAFIHNSKIFKIYNSTLIDFTCLFLMPFILFRAFDIIKPWPIGWIDKNIKSGFGIVLDDMAAAFLATVIHHALIFAFI